MKITPEIVRELLHYNPETGIFVWRERGRKWFKPSKQGNAWKTWNTRFAGKRAGLVVSQIDNGYQFRSLRLLGVRYLEHQLAWLYMTDDPLPEEIDHRNRMATDNRWQNLRASTSAKNSRNSSKSSRNTSGVTGVTWHKKDNRWQAQCKIRGKTHYLGSHDDINDASQAVADFRTANGFDPGHGKELAHYHAS
ncbi:HNH endonuclease [Vreelandella neptunia]|uniref:HNH endonuclease n=1 Tax=Vreelandella neptunia TaxID=115551 RepID=UPI00315AF657|tara:strand:+ start:3821 stop:4399 length:579 start_codon:yes stop_codon:yes gene_type:complete